MEGIKEGGGVGWSVKGIVEGAKLLSENVPTIANACLVNVAFYYKVTSLETTGRIGRERRKRIRESEN